MPTISRTTMARNARTPATAAPTASQPSQSARENRFRISASIQRPTASDRSMPSAAIAIFENDRRRRRGTASGRPPSGTADVVARKGSSASGVITTSLSKLAGVRGFAPSRGASAAGLPPTVKAAGLRGGVFGVSLMPAGLRTGTASPGRAGYAAPTVSVRRRFPRYAADGSARS